MKTSTVFREAQLLISTMKEKYICHAVESVLHDHPCAAKAITEFITTRLGGRYSFERWLKNVHSIGVSSDCPEHQVKVRNTRIAWLDSLIKEFEAKGD